MNQKENKIIKNITIIINVIFCLIFPLSIVALMVSPMVFDAPCSTKDFCTWVFFWAMVSVPIVIFISVRTSLLLFKLKSYKKAFLFSLLPTINFTIMYLLAWIEKF
ncbi:hypothetical protein [Crassaminicella profunda]|uniref:hypothetical protein n=1 Tax=Crassaminicella profunda TaxID=1286698 RepID=UPI001CA76667|nr:hypothetical protein [Crassaminicella profunda]QZY54403.1 hypothetical protein K7H06_15345 [Crassaminicella profunda]